MKAAVMQDVGKPIDILTNIDIIEPRAGEVKVRVRYCSVCHSDLHVLHGELPTYGPTVLGHEAAGVVESVGPGVTRLAPGDHVVLTPVPPCGSCYFCLRSQPQLCANNTVIGTYALADGNTSLSRGGAPIYKGLGVGAFAEWVVSPENGAVKISKDIPLDIACLMGCALQTGVGAVINTAQVETGATVIVMGLGGVGISAVQGASLAGASLILASDPVAERRELARLFGATHVVDPVNENVLELCQQLTDNIGMDYAFETAGIARLTEEAINLIRPGGTTVCVGAPPLDQGIEINPFVMFSSFEKKLLGCLMGSCNSLHEIPRLASLWQSKRLDLENMVTNRRPIEEINEAFDDLKAGRGIRTVLAL